MEPNIICRRVDELGRIVLPIESRRLLGLAPGDCVEIITVEADQRLVLRKAAGDKAPQHNPTLYR